jgi:transposase-like protein
MVIVPKSPSTTPPSSTSNEVTAPRPRRRSFTAADKLRIVREAEAATERGAIEALLRREGIYSSLLAAWRKQLAQHGAEGMRTRKPGRKATRDARDVRIAELERHNARLERDLATTRKLIAIQKKVSELLGTSLTTLESE